jgi:hypothetical protein
MFSTRLLRIPILYWILYTLYDLRAIESHANAYRRLQSKERLYKLTDDPAVLFR